MNYRQLRGKSEKHGRRVGFLLTFGLHACIATALAASGLTWLDPPPPEQSVLVDFIQEEPKATAPKSEKGTRPVVRAPQANIGEEGDVERYEKPVEKPIDRRSLFQSVDDAPDEDPIPKESSPGGDIPGKENTSFDLAGRNPDGGLVPPRYDEGPEGKVVVKIWVNQYGTVTNAIAGAPGTTVTDKRLWVEARNAAMKTKFNASASAPVAQEGVITYIFKHK